MQVLVIDDEEVLARTVCSYLAKRGFEAEYAMTAKAGLAAFSRDRPRMTLLDYRLGDEDGLKLLRRLRQIDRDAGIVMMTGHGDIDIAVDAMKSGARDFLTKPAPLSMIAELAAEMYAEETRGQMDGGQMDGSGEAAGDDMPLILGRSNPARELRQSLRSVLRAVEGTRAAPPPVLISGETGTGKELIARTLHSNGPRAHAPFISINCAALPAQLVEAELFGSEQGAFTDARAEKIGLFEAAAGGVLFLDEVGEMPPAMQSKLLRVLEDRRVRRIGAVRERPVDVWIMSATNQVMPDMVRDGRFRADLMYRLQVLSLEAPPLRMRDSDILLLARNFIAEFAEKYGKSEPCLTDAARAALVSHVWPGNVRELRNVIERATVAATGVAIDAADLGLAMADCAPRPSTASLPEMERSALGEALTECRGNVTRAARRLGISRDTLRYRITKHGLRV